MASDGMPPWGSPPVKEKHSQGQRAHAENCLTRHTFFAIMVLSQLDTPHCLKELGLSIVRSAHCFIAGVALHQTQSSVELDRPFSSSGTFSLGYPIHIGQSFLFGRAHLPKDIRNTRCTASDS